MSDKEQQIKWLKQILEELFLETLHFFAFQLLIPLLLILKKQPILYNYLIFSIIAIFDGFQWQFNLGLPCFQCVVKFHFNTGQLFE